jgi:hypothetical protein
MKLPWFCLPARWDPEPALGCQGRGDTSDPRGRTGLMRENKDSLARSIQRSNEVRTILKTMEAPDQPGAESK